MLKVADVERAIAKATAMAHHTTLTTDVVVDILIELGLEIDHANIEEPETGAVLPGQGQGRYP